MPPWLCLGEVAILMDGIFMEHQAVHFLTYSGQRITRVIAMDIPGQGGVQVSQ